MDFSITHRFKAATWRSWEVLAIAYQYLGGVKAFMTKRLFLFGEYKYFGAKYSWDSDGAGDSKVKLDLQAHLISGGVARSF